MDCAQANRKRKASDPQDHERLSKRLSRLSLLKHSTYSAKSGPFSLQAEEHVAATSPNSSISLAQPQLQPPQLQPQNVVNDDDTMRLDDTKHKVYIYDLDAELSDSDTSDDGKLVFLPDIQKHLRETRIPPVVWANSEGELAGQKQMVLYSVPTSLTVPEEQDSVRKAIIEARARARAKTQEEHTRRRDTSPGAGILHSNGTVSPERSLNTDDWYTGMGNGMPGATNNQVFNSTVQEIQMEEPYMDYDPDAMDLG